MEAALQVDHQLQTRLQDELIQTNLVLLFRFTGEACQKKKVG